MTFRALVYLHRTVLRPISHRTLPRDSPSLSLARFNSSIPTGPPPSQPTAPDTQKYESDHEHHAPLTSLMEESVHPTESIDRDPYPADEIEETSEEPESEFGSQRLKALSDEVRPALGADANDPLSSLQKDVVPPADQNVEFAKSAGEPVESFKEPVESAEPAKERVKSSRSTRKKVFNITDEVVDSEEPVSETRTGIAHAERKNGPKHQLLPLILPPEKGKAVWFGPIEFKRYIRPLYQRGWHMGFQKVLSANVVSHILANRVFTFPNWNQAMEFVDGIADIAKEESHHPHALTMQYQGKVVQVMLTLKTHIALRCKWIHHEEEPIKAPGVTQRDLRLAARLELLYKDRFGGGAPSVLPPLHRQPPIHVIHKLLNVPTRKLQHYCTACGQRHSIEECTAKDTGDLSRFLPLCDRCHQRHAPMAVCPKTRDKYVTPPVLPCPNCGGAHWLEDCRKPQLPPAEARTLMLPLKSEMTLEK